MARTASGKFVSLCCSPLTPNKYSTETTTKTATRRANAKPKDSQSFTSAIYAHALTFFLSADVKAKRKPSAYNLFVKEHMKVYLAEHPGKTNKDAMKHVRLPVLSTSLLSHRVFRSARFGKTHRKIQSVVRKLRRRTLKLLSGRRKLQQRSPRVRVPRLSLAATTERSQVS